MNVLFLYLGRRGPLGQFTLELSHAAEKCPGVTSIFALSKSNPIAAEDAWRAGSLVRIDTFDSAASLATLTRFFTTRRHLAQIIRDRKVDAVVTLMPHLWTPLLVRSVHACGAKYATVIHDFEPHPGDPDGHADAMAAPRSPIRGPGRDAQPGGGRPTGWRGLRQPRKTLAAVAARPAPGRRHVAATVARRHARCGFCSSGASLPTRACRCWSRRSKFFARKVWT